MFYTYKQMTNGHTKSNKYFRILFKSIVAYLLKARSVESREAVVARERL
jgi:hypothetical protein